MEDAHVCAEIGKQSSSASTRGTRKRVHGGKKKF
jgi:hypothetical protein